MKICPKCGKRMETDFCGNCGTDLRDIPLAKDVVINIDLDLNDKNPYTDYDEGAVDLGSQNKDSYPDDAIVDVVEDLQQAKDDFVRSAGKIAGSLGKLAAKKGEQVVDRIDNEFQSASSSKKKKKNSIGNRKKKILPVVLGTVAVIILAFMMIPSGGDSDIPDASNAADGEPINGIWTDNSRSLIIDGTAGYLENSIGSVYKCDINLNQQTVTINLYSWNDTNPTYNYEFVGEKLVLNTDDKKAFDDTFSFSLSKEKMKDSSELSLDGEWVNSSHTLHIDGEKGLMEGSYNPYKCEVNSSNKTIVIKSYSWDDSDPVYSYDFINGKLVIGTTDEKALDSALLFYTKEEYEKTHKTENTSEDQSEDEADETIDNPESKNKNISDEDFDKLMADYEDYFDQFIEVSNSYKEDPSDLKIAAKYFEFMSKYTQVMKDFEELDQSEWTEDQQWKYIEVQNRINSKMLEALDE